MCSISDIILRIEPIKQLIFNYLTPSDISALCVTLNYRLTKYEKNTYMNPLLEIFYDIKWIDKSCEPTSSLAIIGDDIHNISNYTVKDILLYMCVYKIPTSKFLDDAGYDEVRFTNDINHQYWEKLHCNLEKLRYRLKEEKLFGDIWVLYIQTSRIKIYIDIASYVFDMYNITPCLTIVSSNINNITKVWNGQNIDYNNLKIDCFWSTVDSCKFDIIQFSLTSSIAESAILLGIQDTEPRNVQSIATLDNSRYVKKYDI